MSTLSTQSNGQKTSVVGVVTAAYDPEKRERLKDGATYISPGRIYLDVKGTVCEVACWSVDSDKVNMPPFWTGIDFDTIEGRNVVISATYDKEYTNPNTNETKHQYKSPTDIQYLDGDAPTPKEATPEPTGERASTPPPEQPRSFTKEEMIAWNSSVNNANLALLSRLIGTILTSDSAKAYTKLVSALALQFYEVIRRGPVEIVEEVVEPETQDTDLELESF